ncbi:MAG: MarR family winged helix-turn-helix transcriptional regulator [Actinomycetota bacterium]
MGRSSRPLDELQRSLTMVVRRTAIPRVHERIINRAGVDIDRVEAIALSRIADAGSMRVTELADQLGVACSTAGRHAANLEGGGFVTRVPDPEDKRVTVVAVSDPGVELIQRLRDVQRDLLAEALSGWEDDELESLAGLLRRLGEDLIVLSEPESVRP